MMQRDRLHYDPIAREMTTVMRLPLIAHLFEQGQAGIVESLDVRARLAELEKRGA